MSAVEPTDDWRDPGFAWPAPAKINLFLHITGRREDGYHQLQTVFQFLDFGDRLFFSVRDDGRVSRGSDLPGVDGDDLTVRAARALQAEIGGSRGVDIRIDKRIPMGAGLGGGSSDAATTLVALNRLWEVHWPAARLAELGLELGADVPVFILGRAAWAEGVGEVLTPVEPPQCWYVVIFPPVQVDTRVIFQAPELTRDCHPIKIRDFLGGETTNVCEPVVRDRYPDVAEVLDWLAQHGQARMTGTGSAVFAAFETQDQARAVFEQRPANWQGTVAQALNESPLHRQLRG